MNQAHRPTDRSSPGVEVTSRESVDSGRSDPLSGGERGFLAAVLTLHLIVLAWLAIANSPVLDEPAHLAAGVSHWQFGDFRLYRVNPPAVRLVAALPVLPLGPQTDYSRFTDASIRDRSEFAVGVSFIEANRPFVLRYVTFARLACLPFSTLGALVSYLWARELYGLRAAPLALLLYCSCPNLLGWGATITPDAAAAATGLTAHCLLWRWTRSPTFPRALLAGSGLALALVTKSTWLCVLPLWGAAVLATAIMRERISSGSWWRVLVQATVGGTLAVQLLNFVYAFEGSFRPVGSFSFASRALRGEGETGTDGRDEPAVGNRFNVWGLRRVPSPLPENYVRGLDQQLLDFEMGAWSYLRGEHRFRGWWHYYFYALLVKMPEGTLLLLGLSAAVGVGRLLRSGPSFKNILVWGPPLIVLAVVSSQTGFSRYFRYALPALPGLYVWTSRLAVVEFSFTSASRWVVRLAALATVASSAALLPHSLSYFNLASGGAAGGWRHLADANIDWGQDLYALRHWVDRHPEVTPLRVAYVGPTGIGAADVGIATVPIFNDRGGTGGCASSVVGGERLCDGFYAVSVNEMIGYRFHRSAEPRLAGFAAMTPIGRAGYSIYIFHVGGETAVRP